METSGDKTKTTGECMQKLGRSKLSNHLRPTESDMCMFVTTGVCCSLHFYGDGSSDSQRGGRVKNDGVM